MRYRYLTCDVFTDTRFGGNPLAVLPDARGLDTASMQRIAREFNYSESTFVLPPRAGGDREVRIFTPSAEIPFAGHPNVGTAFALAAIGDIPPGTSSVTFEEKAGPVPVSIEWRGGRPLACELRAPEALTLSGEVPVERIAAALRLAPGDVLATPHAPALASVGLPFVFARLRDLDTLARASPDTTACEALEAAGFRAHLHVYVREQGGDAVRARMFAPLGGVGEDPATGSANCALAALLAHLDPAADGEFSFAIEQGVEMGRPSRLAARVVKRGGTVTGTWIGGAAVMVCEGHIEV